MVELLRSIFGSAFKTNDSLHFAALTGCLRISKESIFTDGCDAQPQNYWVNTSGNDIIRNFMNRANATTKNEIELLLNGNSVKKMIRQELTYKDLDSGSDNLWSILFTTGYLTQRSIPTGELTELVIPNKEIRWIFERQIREWFREESTRNTAKLEVFRRGVG